MIDLKKWFLMPSTREGNKLANGDVYGRETFHLEGMNLTNNTKAYSCHTDTGKTMIFTKSQQGWPHDRKAYDSQFIYDTGTELNWTSPNDFKQNGWPMFPRYWNGDPTIYQFNQHSVWTEYVNCKATGVKGDVGPTLYTIEALPNGMDFGGDVGQCDTILLTYYWVGKAHREQLFLTDRAGWVDWTHALFVVSLGQYVVDNRVTHNLIIPGVVVPQFPCQVIP